MVLTHPKLRDYTEARRYIAQLLAIEPNNSYAPPSLRCHRGG